MQGNVAMHLCGAEFLIDGQLRLEDVAIEAGVFTNTAYPKIDLTGYLALPGIIDLHGDAFERHISPRPSAPFPANLGLISTDRDAASNGVTTAYLAQSWSWEGDKRSPDRAEAIFQAIRAYRPHALTDLRVQIRCETHMTHTESRLLKAIADYEIDYVIFNNHLDQALAHMRRDPSQLHIWASGINLSPDDFIDIVERARDHTPKVPRFLCNLSRHFDASGVRYGSHDDPDAQTREYFSMIGARICEFPVSISAAGLAARKGEPVIAGAPNVVRGGSQAGNLAVSSLIREGICDALVSDYHYPALAAAAFRLVDDGLRSLPQAWAMISAAPAQILGLHDRGDISIGKRADLTFIDPDTRRIEGTISSGKWSFLSGNLAGRIIGQGQSNRLIAAQ